MAPQQGVIGLGSNVKLGQITDGTSNTLMLGEISWQNMGAYHVWTAGMIIKIGAEHCYYPCCRNVANAPNSTPYTSPDPAGVALGWPAFLTSNFANTSFGSDHPNGMTNFALADGSVRGFTPSISLGVYMSLASYNGDEPVSPPD